MVAIDVQQEQLQLRFAHELANTELSQVDLAIALLWFADVREPGYEATATELGQSLQSLRLCSGVNTGRLGGQLKKSGLVIRSGRGQFSIRLQSKSTLNSLYSKALAAACYENEPSSMGVISAGATTISNMSRVFIGHGRSKLWRELKDFLHERLGLNWDEFNRESAAGMTTQERLMEMLQAADFAFLVMTAEDEHADGTRHARENVIHEAGLFQGRLGFKRAILLLEDGCEEFSNVHGVVQIRFPKGNINAVSEDVRKVLEREKLLKKGR